MQARIVAFERVQTEKKTIQVEMTPIHNNRALSLSRALDQSSVLDQGDHVTRKRKKEPQIGGKSFR